MDKKLKDPMLPRLKKPTLTLGLSKNIKQEMIRRIIEEKGLETRELKVDNLKELPQALVALEAKMQSEAHSLPPTCNNQQLVTKKKKLPKSSPQKPDITRSEPNNDEKITIDQNKANDQSNLNINGFQNQEAINKLKVEDKPDNANYSKPILPIDAPASPLKNWLIDPKQYKKMLADFKIKYPDAFSIPNKPFAINIHQQLMQNEPKYNKTEIRKFLKVYCGNKGYRSSVILNAERVNLNGEVASLVTEEQLAKDKRKSK